MMVRLCIFCFAQNAAEVRYDRKGRPYFVCRNCHTRSFFRDVEALRGLAICPTLLAAAIARRAEEAAFKTWFDGEIVRTISFVTENSVNAPVRGEQRGLASEPSVVPFTFDAKKGAV